MTLQRKDRFNSFLFGFKSPWVGGLLSLKLKDFFEVLPGLIKKKRKKKFFEGKGKGEGVGWGNFQILAEGTRESYFERPLLS